MEVVAAALARVWLGMGSNLGDRSAHLREGLRRLKRWGCLTAVSSVLETPPFGPVNQPDFLNLVAEFGTEYAPLTLLRAAQAIERAVGRRTTYRWGPRVLDIDLLMYDGLMWETPGLSLPHPRMAERDFVMTPLEEIAPDQAAWVRTVQRK